MGRDREVERSGDGAIENGAVGNGAIGNGAVGNGAIGTGNGKPDGAVLKDINALYTLLDDRYRKKVGESVY